MSSSSLMFLLRLGAPWLICSLVLLPRAHADTPPGTHWLPVPELSDEFNGDQLDPNRWETTNRHYLGKKPGLYVPRNVRTRAGNLELWARSETEQKSPPGYRDFTVAYVASRGKMHYGYVEVRAKAMPSRINSAFWLYRWSETGTFEIDVFEIGAASPGRAQTLHSNVHYYLGNPAQESDHNRRSSPHRLDTGKALTDDFHVFGLEWNERELRFYFDNRLVRRVENRHFHHPMSLRFTAETHPEWFGLPRPGELPAVFLIDHLRVWRAAPETTRSQTSTAPDQTRGPVPGS